MVASPLLSRTDRAAAGRTAGPASGTWTAGPRPTATPGRYPQHRDPARRGPEAWQRFLADPVRYVGGDPRRFRAAVLGALNGHGRRRARRCARRGLHPRPADQPGALRAGPRRRRPLPPGYGSVTRLIAARRGDRRVERQRAGTTRQTVEVNPLGDDASVARRMADYLSGSRSATRSAWARPALPVGFSWLTFACRARGLDGGPTREVDPAPGFGRPLRPTARAAPGAVDALARRQRGARAEAPTGTATTPRCSARPSCSARRWPAAPSCPGSRPASRRWKGLPAPPGYRVHRRARRAAPAGLARQPIAAHAGGQAHHARNAARLNVEHWEAQIERWAMRPYPLAGRGRARWLKAHTRWPNGWRWCTATTAPATSWSRAGTSPPSWTGNWCTWATRTKTWPGSACPCTWAAALRPAVRARAGSSALRAAVRHRGLDRPRCTTTRCSASSSWRPPTWRRRAASRTGAQRHAHAGDGQPGRHLPAPDGQGHRGPA